LIPIRDENRSRTEPYITRILLIVNIIVFFVAFLPEFSSGNWLSALLGLSESTSLDKAILTYGMFPYEVLQGQRLYTLFTSMFLHADLWHLGGNMLYLYIFGDNVEDTFGHGRYAFFYLLAGIVASAAHIMILLYSVEELGLVGSWALYVPAIGASGAISGVLGAYLVLYPRARILTLVVIGWFFILPIPAVFFLGFWFIYQLLYGMLALEVPVGVAYWAHIGGFLAGSFFGLIWRGRRKRALAL